MLRFQIKKIGRKIFININIEINRKEPKGTTGFKFDIRQNPYISCLVVKS